MSALVRTLRVEFIKTRRTLSLAVAFLIPATVAILNLMILLDRRADFIANSLDVWEYLARNNLTIWSLMMVPLFVTLETALLNLPEHSQKTWKMMFATPVPRWTIYAAKQVVALALAGVGMLSIIAATLVSGFGLKLLIPGLNLQAPIPWDVLLLGTLYAYLACWLIVSIHLWVSARWPNFAIASAVGIIATVTAVAVINSRFGPYYPWTLSGIAVGTFTGQLDWGFKLTLRQMLLEGVLGGLIFAALAAWDISRKEIL